MALVALKARENGVVGLRLAAVAYGLEAVSCRTWKLRMHLFVFLGWLPMAFMLGVEGMSFTVCYEWMEFMARQWTKGSWS